MLKCFAFHIHLKKPHASLHDDIPKFKFFLLQRKSKDELILIAWGRAQFIIIILSAVFNKISRIVT